MSRNIAPTLHHIIDTIYEASRRPSGWQASLDQLRDYLHARSAVLLYRNHRLSRASFAVFSGIDSARLGDCENISWFDEERQRVAYVDAGVLFPVSLPSSGSGSATGCYHRLGIVHAVRGWLFHDSEHSALIEFHRDEAGGPFESGMREWLLPLSEHFERALRIYAMTSGERLRARALGEGLEQLTMGVVLFEENGTVVYHNKAADGLLRHHPGVQLRQQRLVVKEPAQAERLRQALTAIAQAADGVEAPSSSLALGESEEMLQGWVMPLDNRRPGPGQGIERAVAALYLSDAQRSVPLRVEPLMVIYHLTRKEAEVAVAIAAGRSVEEIAQLHSRSLNTVRSQLKAVFRKTGTQRQSELVALVLDGAHLLVPLSGVVTGESQRG